eukprot:Nk52_evm56s914 gene=Nk52_evmTU56s914
MRGLWGLSGASSTVIIVVICVVVVGGIIATIFRFRRQIFKRKKRNQGEDGENRSPKGDVVEMNHVYSAPGNDVFVNSEGMTEVVVNRNTTVSYTATDPNSKQVSQHTVSSYYNPNAQAHVPFPYRIPAEHTTPPPTVTSPAGVNAEPVRDRDYDNPQNFSASPYPPPPDRV